MKGVLALIALMLALASLGATASAAKAAPPATDANLEVPISGTVAGVSNFVGTFTLDRFTTRNGELAAVGTLEGTLTNLVTSTTQTVNQAITLPVAQATGTCQILHLELGPLDLNLLGLMVHLDQVVLDITAQSGPGNLLGNLLCGIAGLLDQGNTPLNQLVNLLNQLLNLL
jgi:hypothetical protein